MSVNTVVHAYKQQPAAVRAFFLQLVELILECLLICKRVVALERERGDIVHAEGIGNGDEVLTLTGMMKGSSWLGSSMV
jgi:hypothetical protein